MFGKYILLYLTGGILAVGSYGAAALLHEGGHALFGKFSGGVCLWVRLGAVLWIPGGGILIRAKRRDFVAAGECVLLCPDKKSLLWAACGGGAANLISALTASIFLICRGKRGGEIFCLGGIGILLFIICSLLMAFLSLCSWRGQEESDGALAKKCREEEFCRYMQRNQQKDFLRLEYGLIEEMF